jgi:Beta-lactamase class C and other penicillin binding proteins
MNKRGGPQIYRTKYGFGAFICTIVIAACSQPCRADKVDDLVNEHLARTKLPAASIAVIQNGKVIKARGYGLADVEKKVPATEKTVYELGSITKQFTSTAIMMLVEEGKFRLDDKITGLLPGLPKAWSGVTVRHLLTHTSGIMGYTELPDFMTLTVKDATHEEVIKSVADKPMRFQPGEKWSYSNTGYFLLGMLIEKVTGKSYGAFLQERIFRPLRMTDTRVNDLSAAIPNRACGYTIKGGAVEKAPAISMTWPYSAGVLVSTVVDMAKWDAAVGAGKLLKKSSWKEVWTPVKLNDGSTHPYGFGWAVGTVNGHQSVGHGGGIPGFTTDYVRYPDDGLSVVVLTNSNSTNPEQLRQIIVKEYAPSLAPPVTALPDKVPEVTALVRTLLQELELGSLKPERFTDKMKTALFPDKFKEAQPLLKRFGEMKDLSLVNRKEGQETRAYQYLARFKSGALRINVVLDKGGKIAGLFLAPE